MPRRPSRMLVPLLAVVVCALSPVAHAAGADAGPRRAADASAVTACQIGGLIVRDSDYEPASGVSLVVLGGGSMTTDSEGLWLADVPELSRVTVRILAADAVIAVGVDYAVAVPPGTSEMSFTVHGRCITELNTFAVIVNNEIYLPRPPVPPMPRDIIVSDVTRAAALPGPTPGDAANVPWLGAFWLTAPFVPIAVCGLMDTGTQIAAEAAIQRWTEAGAAGLGWKVVRDDTMCDAPASQPKVLIRRDPVTRSRAVLGRTRFFDQAGQRCRLDGNGGTCWVGTVQISLNPAGFDRLRPEAQSTTVLHEIGHALGAAHSRQCGDSLMWYEARGCPYAPRAAAGSDDVASLNELLALTLPVLQAAQPSRP